MVQRVGRSQRGLEDDGEPVVRVDDQELFDVDGNLPISAHGRYSLFSA